MSDNSTARNALLEESEEAGSNRRGDSDFVAIQSSNNSTVNHNQLRQTLIDQHNTQLRLQTELRQQAITQHFQQQVTHAVQQTQQQVQSSFSRVATSAANTGFFTLFLWFFQECTKSC